MGTEDSILKSVAAATPKLVQILTPLTPEGRRRAVASAMMVFGEAPPSVQPLKQSEKTPDQEAPHTAGDGICQKALSWMKKNSVTREQLEHVFAIDKDAIDVIASKMPEKTKTKQTKQVYALCGVATYLRTGEMSFQEKEARELCEKVGCFDRANHGYNTSKFGNLITGSKDSGWKITIPGLNEGLTIIKQLQPDIPN